MYLPFFDDRVEERQKGLIKGANRRTAVLTSGGMEGQPNETGTNIQRRVIHERVQIKSNQYSFNSQNTTTDTDAKVVYIIPKLLAMMRVRRSRDAVFKISSLIANC